MEELLLIEEVLPQDLIIVDEFVISLRSKGEMDDRGYVAQMLEKEDEQFGRKGIHYKIYEVIDRNEEDKFEMDFEE